MDQPVTYRYPYLAQHKKSDQKFSAEPIIIPRAFQREVWSFPNYKNAAVNDANGQYDVSTEYNQIVAGEDYYRNSPRTSVYTGFDLQTLPEACHNLEPNPMPIANNAAQTRIDSNSYKVDASQQMLARNQIISNWGAPTVDSTTMTIQPQTGVDFAAPTTMSNVAATSATTSTTTSNSGAEAFIRQYHAGQRRAEPFNQTSQTSNVPQNYARNPPEPFSRERFVDSDYRNPPFNPANYTAEQLNPWRNAQNTQTQLLNRYAVGPETGQGHNNPYPPSEPVNYSGPSPIAMAVPNQDAYTRQSEYPLEARAPPSDLLIPQTMNSIYGPNQMTDIERLKFFQNIQPTSLSYNDVAVPINANLGISYNPSYGPLVRDQVATPNGTTPLYHRIDPQLVRDGGLPAGRLAEMPMRSGWSAAYDSFTPQPSTDWTDIYDARMSSYGDGQSAYEDKVSGTIQYYTGYGVDAYKYPNFFDRSKVDFVQFTDPLGRNLPEYHRAVGVADVKRQVGEQWDADSLYFRENLMESQMRKRNQESWQLRYAPFMKQNNTHFGTAGRM